MPCSQPLSLISKAMRSGLLSLRLTVVIAEKYFVVIMRAMTAAAIPFARSGYEVLIDFSIPPQFLETARKILKEVPLN